ncbi:uncharacterized protein LOC111830939 [Capsella rubella]|nr:uncharacterized protein LOC111830939 [Capsella rubella]
MKRNLWFIALVLVLSLAILSCEASNPSYVVRKLLIIGTPPSSSRPAGQH